MRPNRFPRRRTAPAWVQDLSDTTLHGLAVNLRVQRIEQGLSLPQEWLWDRVIDELVFRSKAMPATHRCDCDLCVDFEPYRDLTSPMDADKGPFHR